MKKPPVKKLDQSDYIKTNIRLPPQLHAEVIAEGERNGRSMNAEIIARLQQDKVAEVLSELADLKSMMRVLMDKI